MDLVDIADALRERVLHSNDPGVPPDLIEVDDPLFCTGTSPPFRWNPNRVALLCRGLSEYQVACVGDALVMWWNLRSMWPDADTDSLLDSYRRAMPNAMFFLGVVAAKHGTSVRGVVQGC